MKSALLLALFISTTVNAQQSMTEPPPPKLQTPHAQQQPATKEFSIIDTLGHHLTDEAVFHLPPIQIGATSIDMSITKRVVMMWIVSILLILIFVGAARSMKKRAGGKPGRFTGVVEVFVQWIRTDISEASMGAKHAKNYDPYLLTIFFFILFCNLIGLIPPLGELVYIVGEVTGVVAHHAGSAHHTPLPVKLWPGITSTGDINVNGVLAVATFLLVMGAGFINQGPLFPFLLVPKGVPFALGALLLFPIELAGMVIKNAVLAIRLLANMTAGHIIILVLLSFTFMFKNGWLALAGIPSAAAIYFLELLVAFLQAYIFTFLTALFIGSAQHRH